MKKYFLAILVSLNFAVAHAGQETHGGDPVVASFYTYATQLKNCIAFASTFRENEVYTEFYYLTFADTRVYSQDRTFILRNEVDAINYPDRI
jgi:hypothetical protein